MQGETFEQELVAGAVNNLKSKAKGKIISLLLKLLLPFLPVLFVALMLFGAADSITSLLSGLKNENNESLFTGMTDEEIEIWMNDPENIYNALNSGSLELNGSTLLMLDEDTTKRIFERIHVWQERRSMSKEVTYTYRTERTVDEEGERVALEDMDYLGTISSDSSDSPTGIDYSGEKSITINRGDVEMELDENGTSIFDIRWQPIYAVCTMAAIQNYDNWGSYKDVDNDAATPENMDLENYYLSDKQIDDIIDIFYFNAVYYYDAIKGNSRYEFKNMVVDRCAFKLATSTGDTARITERIPCSAPQAISNAYIRYDYQYTTEGQCYSRMYTCIPTSFYSACEAVVPDFDMDWFLEVLEILPCTDDIYASFTTEEFQSMMPENSVCTDSSICPSIGVYYHERNGESSSGGNISFDGSFTIPYYDYINPDTAHLGSVYFIADNKPEGADYGLYEISNAALKPFTQSDGLTADQLANVISQSNYHKNAGARGCILFDTDEHIRKTAQVFADYQNANNVSPLFYLAIMRTEGAISSSYGINYYNFFNFTSSSYVIPGSKGFRDYKSQYGDPWVALEVQLAQIYERYAVERGQINYYQMVWKTYDGVSYASLSMSYCPPYDDTSMPWVAGSYYNKGSGNVPCRGGVGWVNSNASYRTALENIATDLGYEMIPFTADSISSDTIGSSLMGWLQEHLPGLFGGGSDNESEEETP